MSGAASPLLVAYLALPLDLVPDFIPVLGYADDVIVVAVVLRSVVRTAGPHALEQHWRGTPTGLPWCAGSPGSPDRQQAAAQDAALRRVSAVPAEPRPEDDGHVRNPISTR